MLWVHCSCPRIFPNILTSRVPDRRRLIAHSTFCRKIMAGLGRVMHILGLIHIKVYLFTHRRRCFGMDLVVAWRRVESHKGKAISQGLRTEENGSVEDRGLGSREFQALPQHIHALVTNQSPHTRPKAKGGSRLC